MTQGYVLHAPLLAPSNSPTTAEPASGVIYDVAEQHPLLSGSPPQVNAAADQYRAAILDSSDPAQTFLIWAANTASLAIIADPTWYVRRGSAVWSDADPYTVLVQDDEGRSIHSVVAIVIALGDATYEDQGWEAEEDITQGRSGPSPYLVFVPESASTTDGRVDLRLGSFQPDLPLSETIPTGLSSGRGDHILEVVYSLQPATFWWSRNDAQDTRFAWDASLQRWTPLKGSAPTMLGVLLTGSTYLLNPPPRGAVGDLLEGDAQAPDSHALLRLGTYPDASSTPLGRSDAHSLTGVRIVTDEEALAPYDFTSSDSSAIVGISNGILQVNPVLAREYAGLPLWYSPDTFTPASSGDLGSVTGPLFLTPIPEEFQRPFIRINNRSYLTPIIVQTEGDLPDATNITTGQCAIAMSTGRLVLSAVDVAKATMTSPSFDIHLTGARVYYDGVAMNAVPQPLQRPLALIQGDGASETVHLREPMYLGLSDPSIPGSGVLTVPDGSGRDPRWASTRDASLRPGGDYLPPIGGGLGPVVFGLIRKIEDGLGDTILFGRQGAIAHVRVVDRASDVPSPITEPGTAYVVRESSTVLAGYSTVHLSDADRKTFVGTPLYFLQASLKPSFYTEDGKIFSRKRFHFEVSSDASLYFTIDGDIFQWDASSLTPAASHSASEIATSIQKAIRAQGGDGDCYAQAGRIVLESALGGYVGILWGVDDNVDTSGAAALGFLPGWVASAGDPTWLPDTGISIGFHRNQADLTRTQGLPDVRHVAVFDGILGTIAATPFTFLNNNPLEDIPGFAPNIFFSLRSSTGQDQLLPHLTSIQHRFHQGRFDWITQKRVLGLIDQPTSTLHLEASGVLPESLHSALGGGLLVASDGGSPTAQAPVVDYLLEQDGSTGNIRLTRRLGAPVHQGYHGSGSGTLFTDPTASFTDDLVGSHLLLTGSFHQVVAVPTSTSLQVKETLAPIADTVAWELFQGASEETFDASIVADAQFVPFAHVDPEAFALFKLTPLGTMTGQVQWPASFPRGREVFLRAARSQTRILVDVLPQEALGTLAQDTLLAPTTMQGLPLWVAVGNTPRQAVAPVSSLTTDPSGVEVLTAAWGSFPAGTLRFPATVLSSLVGSEVWIGVSLHEPSSPSRAFYDPDLRILQVSPTAVPHGQVLYLAERLAPLGANADISVAPLSGAISLREPLCQGALVEVTYFKALPNGQRTGSPITETLTHFVSREPLVRLSNTTFHLDAPGRHAIDDRIEPIVYIGPTQQNYGGARDFTVTSMPGFPGRLVTFTRPLPEDETPVATYGVFDARGGERTLQVSTTPVYLPPFFIPANKSTFGLRGDARPLAPIGSLLRLGNDCIYVTAHRYDSSRDITLFDFQPPTFVEIGSRAPGGNAPAWVTNLPMLPDVAPSGFFHVLPPEQTVMSPLFSGQNTVSFTGDLTSLLVPGHLLDLSGTPFIITACTLLERGSLTQATLASPARRAFEQADTEVRVSARPIYPPGSRTFLGTGAILDASAQVPAPTLILYRGGQGRALTRRAQWDIDPQTGVLHIVDPLLGLADEKLVLLATHVRTLAPFYGGRQERILPRWEATFAHLTIPSASNGLLGRTLAARFTYRQPDTFLVSVQPLEASLAALLESQDALRPPGLLGPRAAAQRLQDFDRAARHMLALQHTIISSIEGIMVSTHGRHVGDRDGQFRFEIKTGHPWTPPGFEDAITGRLNPRNLFAEVFRTGDPSRDIEFLPTDPLAIPSECVMTGGTLSGPPLTPEVLHDMAQRQRALARNDLDDIVLVSSSSQRIPRTTAPWFDIVQTGVFSTMAKPHAFSRLFPTQTRFHTTLTPGIGADPASGYPGVFAWQRGTQSTWQKQIGQVSNPVLGNITTVLTVQVQDRLPRAHLWGFYPNGLPSDVFGDPIEDPCLVVTMQPPSETPRDLDTGFPDISHFLSQGGDSADAIAGDPGLHIPGFARGQQIAWGFPDGSIYRGLYPEEVRVGNQPTYTGLFIDDVLYGCVLLLADRHGSRITDPSYILVGSTATEAYSATLALTPPATVLVIPPDLNPPSDEALTTSVLSQAASAMPGYRTGTDIQVTTDGRILDISLPSQADPALFPLKEITGQRPPAPLSALEGAVWLTQASPSHIPIPALRGEPLNDAGDHTLPYLAGDQAEIHLLANLARALGTLITNKGLFPDEIPFTDGRVLATASEGLPPATLIFDAPHPDTPLVQMGDLLFVETSQDSPEGYQGILSVGSVEEISGFFLVKPPRFVTPSGEGAPMRYLLNNYFVYTTPNNYPLDPQAMPPDGARLFTTGGDTIISLQDTDLILREGLLNNLADILQADVLNTVVISFYSRPDTNAVNSPAGAGTHGPATQGGQEILRIEIRQEDARAISEPFAYDSGFVDHGGALFGVFHTSNPGGEIPPTLDTDYRHIILTDWLEIPMVPSTGTPSQWFLPHILLNAATPSEARVSLYGLEVSISVDTLDGQSTTAAILPDRLTFTEVIDTRYARPRGFQTIGNPYGTQTLETSLRVAGVMLPSLAWSDVNDVTGGLLTFPATSDDTPDLIPGSWTGSGHLQVASFEADNDPIPLEGLRATIQTSSEADVPAILDWRGDALENHIIPDDFPTDGSLSNVLPGDIVVISASTHPTMTATEKAGTYIVKHVVLSDAEVSQTIPFGLGIGWLPTRYPRVLSWDSDSDTLITTNETMPSAGFLHITLDESLLSSPDIAVWRTAIVTTEYTALPTDGADTLTISTGTWHYADGTVVTSPATLGDLAGYLAGWSTLDGQELALSIQGGPLPEDSVVGQTQVGVSLLGLAHMGFSTEHGLISYGVADMTLGAASPGLLKIEAAPKHPAGTLPLAPASVYDDVPGWLTVVFDGALWNTLYNPHGHSHAGPGPTPYHLLPNTSGTVGFKPSPGIWLEPGIPQQPLPLGGPGPLVVSARHSLLNSQVGMRSPDTLESVLFEVRRVRRWHQPLIDAQAALAALRPLYETRRGIVTSFYRLALRTALLGANNFTLDWNNANPSKPRTGDVWNTQETCTGTQLGGFTEAGVRPGDTIRILADDDSVLGTGTISDVLSNGRLRIEAPSLEPILENDILGCRFEIYLRHQPPQEQSWEQLVDAAFEVVHITAADRSDPDPLAWTGGFVPALGIDQDWEDAANLLCDDSVPRMDTLGILPGDFIVIDAAGTLPNNERGAPPQGDLSVALRDSIFEGGRPHPLDDNRGVYQVLEVTQEALIVDPTHFLAAARLEIKVQTTSHNAAWSVLPTIYDSTLAHVEGQNDLRPTHHTVDGTYAPPDLWLRGHSIRPFSYRVLRPRPSVGLDMAYEILVLRERTLSWIEKMGLLFAQRRGGTLYQWQEGEAISRLTTPGDLRSGMDVLTDEALQAFYGQSTAPFANAPDCLTVMDRRVFLSDPALESTSMDPDFQATPILPGEPFGQPMGPLTDPVHTGDRQSDYMRQILDTRDQLRALRDAWITMRAHRTQGLLTRIEQANPTDVHKDALTLIRRRT